MGRGLKVLIGVVAVLAVLVGINVFVTDGETKSAEITMPDGRLLSLPAGEVQVVVGARSAITQRPRRSVVMLPLRPGRRPRGRRSCHA